MSHGSKRFPVVGCLPFQAAKAGFALPLFSHPTDATRRIVQEVDEFRGTIAGFKTLDAENPPSEEIFVSGPSARIGGDVLYAFI
jgi:hypothetical protein